MADEAAGGPDPDMETHTLPTVGDQPIRKRHVGVLTMPKVEPAGLGDLYADIPAALVDRQQ